MADSITGLGTGIPIFSAPLEWSKDVAYGLAPFRTIIQYPGTITSLYDNEEMKPESFSFTVTLMDESEIFAFLDFFKARMGRWQKFWYFIDRSDFLPQDDFDVGSSSIKVLNDGYAAFENHRLCIYLWNGDKIVREITNAVPALDGSYISLDLDLAMDRTVLMDDVMMIGRVVLCRFDVDSIQMEYLSVSKAIASIRFYELVKEYSEVA